MSVKKLIAGKHTCVGRLNSGGQPGEKRARLEKPALLVYCGTFMSMDGEVVIDDEIIDLLLKNHNLRIDQLASRGLNAEEMLPQMPPLQLDHSVSARDTVGRVAGRVSKGLYTNEAGIEVSCLMADQVVILGEHNVEHVLDGRWSNVSIGANLETGVINELSITPFPAAPSASLLLSAESTAKQTLDNESAKKYNARVEESLGAMGISCVSRTKELKQSVITLTDEADAVIVAATFEQDPFFKPVKRSGNKVTVGFSSVDGYRLSEKGDESMHEKLKKHLMEKHKMSDKEADEHMGKMKGHLGKKLADDKKTDEAMAALSEDEMSKLSDEVKKSEADEKLAAETDEGTEGDKKDKEMSARLSAAKPRIIALAKAFKSGLAAAKSEAKGEMIMARVSRLRASAKMTPAEQKKINLTELAKQSDAELSAYFRGFEERESVIDTRFHGTTKALSLASLSRMTSDKRMATYEAEARMAGIGAPPSEAHKEVLSVEKQLPATDMGGLDDEKPDAMLAALEAMLGSHDQRDAVMAHVKKMMGMKSLGEMPADQAEESEKKMSALAQNVNKLQTEFQDLIGLFGETAGFKSAELE